MKRLAVLLLAVSACSGGTSTGVSKADYLARAEAICAQANRSQDGLATPTAVDALAPYVARIVAIADQAATELRALAVPEADRSDLEVNVLTPLEEQLEVGHDYADEVAAAAKARDNAELVRLLGDPPTRTRADLRWMKAYGFKECVESADTSG